MTRRHPQHGYSLRDLQSLLGVSRRVLSGLVAAGFIAPTRGRRNELRFNFRDVVLLRTALSLQTAKIPSRRILQALAKLRNEMPDEAPLTGLRLSAVGSAVAVRTGQTQWDASSGQLLLDFGEPDVQAGITVMESAQANLRALEKQADAWYALAEELQETDPEGAERAYRKVLELSPEPHYQAFNNLGALLSRDESRCADALQVFEVALEHFSEAELLHYNRAVQLENLNRLEEAAEGYLRCVQMNAHNDDALVSRASVLEEMGRLDEAAEAFVQALRINPENDEALSRLERLLGKLNGNQQSVIRHLSALRRSNA